MMLKRCLIGFALLSLIGLVVYDSKQHFDADLISLKREHRSAQRDWNIFYRQNYVFYDSSLRYEQDLLAISRVVQSGAIVLSDLATSYYLSTYLNLYVKRVHRHQGLHRSGVWHNLFKQRTACYLHIEGNLEKLKAAAIEHNTYAQKYNRLLFKYIVANKDTSNRNLRYDCLWHGRNAMIDNVQALSKLVYEGEYLNVYELNARLVEIP